MAKVEIEALESLKNFDMGGITGPVTYGTKDRKGSDYCKLYKADVEKGSLIPISGWIKPNLNMSVK